jgi:hypothetical protein
LVICEGTEVRKSVPVPINSHFSLPRRIAATTSRLTETTTATTVAVAAESTAGLDRVVTPELKTTTFPKDEYAGDNWTFFG